jgi:hypothetical protein
MVSELKVLGFRCYILDTLEFLLFFFSTTFQKEQLGGYLVDGSRYIGLKLQLVRPYNFIDTTYVT